MTKDRWSATVCKVGDWEVPAGKLVRLVRGAARTGHFNIARLYLEKAREGEVQPGGRVNCLLAMEMAARKDHPARRSATIGRARRR